MGKIAKIKLAFLLFIVMTITQSSIMFAATPYAPPKEPSRPRVDSYDDNVNIHEYNKKVDEYNKSVSDYNKSVDKEYYRAVAENNKRNNDIKSHNDNEIRAAAEYNARVDQEYAKAVEAERQRIEDQKQKNADEYEAAKLQYESDCAKYQSDLYYEQRILALGYESVEQYNDKINKAYNEQARQSVEKNKNATALSVSDAYTVHESENRSGNTVLVRIVHNFCNTDVRYEETFTIDANDTIIAKSFSAPAENTTPGYAQFYYYTDENHTMGIWTISDSYVSTNAKINEDGWDCGDTHTISFSQGTIRPYDETGIDIVYNYFWTGLRIYNTYNVPVEPTAPEKKECNENPEDNVVKGEYYTPDLWELIPSPTRMAYAKTIPHIGLFPVPANVASTPTVAYADNSATRHISIEGAATPTTTYAVRQASNKNGFWALINLIAAILTVLVGVFVIVKRSGKKDSDKGDCADDESDSIIGRICTRVLSIIAAAVSVITFILTEDMSLKIQMIDRWTIVMILLLIAQVVLAASSMNTQNKDNKK